MSTSDRQKLAELKEMFPNHSPEVIENVFIKNRRRIEDTINILLSMPPTKQKPARARDVPAPTTVKTPSGSAYSHIFPADFLRFPKDVQYVKVYDEDKSTSLIGDGEYNDMARDIDTEAPNAVKDLSLENFSSASGQGAWESIKQKLSQRTGYGHI